MQVWSPALKIYQIESISRLIYDIMYLVIHMQIYKITNLITGLSYIGKDQNDNPYYMGSGLLLWNSYRKRFNRDDLNFEKRTHHKWVYEQNSDLKYYEKTVLHTCDDPNELCALEKYYINKYNTIRPNGYNIADGGDGGCLIAGYTEEEKELWKEKISKATKDAMERPGVRARLLDATSNKDELWRRHISEALTGRTGLPMSEENKKKLSERSIGNQYGVGNKSRTGYRNSEEMNRRISEGLKNVIHTKEWNEKVGDALRGKPKTEAHKNALRKPKPKYKWLLPDGTTRIMDASNGIRHKDWIRLEKVEQFISDQDKSN